MRRLSSILDRVSIFKKDENQQWATKPNAPTDINTETDLICRMIVSAAQSFEQRVQSILYDSAGLSGDFPGFYSLLSLLEKDDNVMDIIGVCRSNGKGCLYVLEQQINHPKFVELCNSVSLAGALISVLRLLRMMEIKHVPVPELTVPDHSYDVVVVETQPGSLKRTALASKRVCRVLGELCADPQTVDQIRSSLIKLFTLPLCPLPYSGVYLQAQSCEVIERLCSSGLTSQIVWFLHDTQAVHQMVRQFSEMVGTDEDLEHDESQDVERDREVSDSKDRESGNQERLRDLRGLLAEKESMWVGGCRCFVALMSAASLFTPVLTTDFVTAGGVPQFAYMLQHSADERITDMMSLIPRLFYCGDKSSVSSVNDGSNDNVITFIAAGEILAGVLVKTVGLMRPVQADETYDKLYRTANALRRNRKAEGMREYYLQHLAYALLTTYSLSQRNCQVLENAYQYLPTLTLALPSLTAAETVSAIVTLLSYVSQCIDNSASMSITAACASTSVIIDVLLGNGAHPLPVASEFEELCNRLAALCGFFEMALRASEKHAKMTIRTGLFQRVFTEPFELLKRNLTTNSAPMDDNLVPVYEKLIDFGIALQFDSPVVADELRKCRLLQLSFDIITMSNVSVGFIRHVMLLYKAVGCCDGVATNLEETLQLLMRCLQHPSFRCQYHKLTYVLTATSEVLLHNGDSGLRSTNKDQETLDLWHALSGYDTVLVVLISMHDLFLKPSPAALSESESESTMDGSSVDMEEVFLCMQAAIATLSFAFSLQISDIGSVSGSSNCRGLVPLGVGMESAGFTSEGEDDGFASVVTSQQSGHNESDYNHFVDKLSYYHQRIAEAMLNSRILLNPSFISRIVDVLCVLIKGTSPTPTVQNPYAFGIALDLLHYLDVHCGSDCHRSSGGVKQQILQMLIDCVGGSTRNGQTLCSHKVSIQIVDNLVSFIRLSTATAVPVAIGNEENLSKISTSQMYLIMLVVHVFKQSISNADIVYILSQCICCTGRNPRSPDDSAKLICHSSSISCGSYTEPLDVLCNNNCSSYLRTRLLLPRECYYQYPWQSIGCSSSRGSTTDPSTMAWDPVKYLSSLGQDGGTHENVPYICLGRNLTMQPPTGEKSKNPCSYLTGNLGADSPGGKIFCVSSSVGFSFGCWLRIPSPDSTIAAETETGSLAAFHSRNPIIPLISLGSLPGESSFLEAHYDHVMGMVRVLTSKTSGGFVINQFKTPYQLTNDTWNQITLTVKRPKRFAMTTFKSHVEVYFNSVLGAACDSDMIDIEYPASTSSAVNVLVGYIKMCKLYDVSTVTGVVSVYDPVADRWNRAEMETVRSDDTHCSIFNTWHLGPTVLFDDVLTHAQVADILLLGPSYTGAFKDISMPLYQSSIAHSSTMLSRFNFVEAPVDRTLAMMGYPPEFLCVTPDQGPVNDYSCHAVRNVADKVDDVTSQHSAAAVLNAAATATGGNTVTLGSLADIAAITHGSSFPNPVLLLNALNSSMVTVPIKMQKNQAGDYVPVSSMFYNGGASSYVNTSFRAGHIKAKVIFNAALDCVEKSTADEMSLDFMEHRYANGSFTPDSVSSAVFSLGSPAVLLPVLHQAATEEDICVGLKLVKHVSYDHIANMKFLASQGYNCIAYLLSTKPPSMFREAAFDTLFDLAVDTGFAYVVGTTAVDTRLLTDLAAFRLLILNHQVWDIGRYSLANKFVQRLNLLLTDQRYEAINCKRLVSVGTVHWLLMMMVAGANKCNSYSRNDSSSPSAIDTNNNSNVNDGAKLSSGKSGATAAIDNDKWHIHCCDKQDADANDIWDPFISQVVGCLRRMMAHDVVKADVECITQCIIYTLGVNASSKFEDVDLVKSTSKIIITSNKHSRSFSTDSANGMTEGSSTSKSRPLPPLPPRSPSGSVEFTVPLSSTGSLGARTVASPVSKGAADETNESETPLLKPMDMVRIHLLKFLIYLFDMNMSAWYDQAVAQTDRRTTSGSSAANMNTSAGASPAGKLFTSVLSPAWFFVLLESSKDPATISLTLRLLAMLMQTNPAFLHDFSSREGFNIITPILTKQVQPLAVVLPLIGLLFRIPMSMLPQACQILDKEGSMLTKLLELEEFEGPNVEEPGRSELTMPMLSLILECYSCSARAKEAAKELPAAVVLTASRGASSTAAASPEDFLVTEEVTQNGIIIAVFKRAMLRSNGFRQLMQHRTAMEFLSTAMFNCSNANDEYGAKIHLKNSRCHPDGLLSVCKSDYISSTGAVKHYPLNVEVDAEHSGAVGDSSSSGEGARDQEEKPANLSVLPSSEIILFEDGIYLTEILELIVHDAIYYANNKMILVTSLLSFPQHASELFVRGFQTLIFNKIRVFLEMVLKIPSLSSFALVSSIFTLVIPLVKARVIDDDVLMEMLKFNISAFEIISAGPVSLLREEEKGQEKLLALLREFGTNARYLSIMCIYAGESQHIRNKLNGLTASDAEHVASRTAKLKYIRVKLTLLCVSSFSEEVTDWSYINVESTSRMVTSMLFGKTATEQIEGSGVKPSGAVVLDAYNAPWVVGDDGPSTKKQIDALWTLATTEISKISQLFVPLVLQACLNLIMGDSSDIRCEALRMCACLVISRRQYTEQILGNMAMAPAQLAGTAAVAALDSIGTSSSTKSALGTRARLRKMIRGSGSFTPTSFNNAPVTGRTSIVITEPFGDFEDDSEDGEESDARSSSNGSQDGGGSDLLHPLAFKLAFIKLTPEDCTAYYAFLTDKDAIEPVQQRCSVPTSGSLSSAPSTPNSTTISTTASSSGGRMKINTVNRKGRNASIGSPGSAGSFYDESFRESEEILFADFVHWIYDNEPKVQKILDALDTSLGSVIPSTASVTEVIVKLQSAREPHVVKAREDLKSMVNQTNDVRKFEDSVRSGHLRRWMALGVVDIMSGACLWRVQWNQMQTMPLWGKVCQLSLMEQIAMINPSSDISSAAGRGALKATAAFVSSDEPVLEFNTNSSHKYNAILMNSRKREETQWAVDLHDAVGYVRSTIMSDDAVELNGLASRLLAAQRFRQHNWRLLPACGPEMMRRRMERNFGEPLDTEGMVASMPSAEVSPAYAVTPVSPDSSFVLTGPSDHERFDSSDLRTPGPTTPNLLRKDSSLLSNKKMDMEGLKHNMEDFLKKIVKTGVIRKEVNEYQDNVNADLVALHYENEEEDGEDGEGEMDDLAESTLNLDLMMSPVPPPRPTPVRESSSAVIDATDDSAAPVLRPGVVRDHSESVIGVDGESSAISSLVSASAASSRPVSVRMNSASMLELDLKLVPPAAFLDAKMPVAAEVEVDLDMEATVDDGVSAAEVNGQIDGDEEGKSKDEKELSKCGPTINTAPGPAAAMGSGGAGVQLLTSTEEDSSASRANLLQEIVCGIVGRSEWNDGFAVNVSRINGLAVDTSLFIITSKAVHLLKGFQVRVVVSKKGTQRVLEWAMSDENKQFIDEQNEPTPQWHRKGGSGSAPGQPKSPSSASAQLSRGGIARDCFPTSGDRDESRLLEEIYRQLLSSDTAYTVVPLDEIFIIYRHRYQLKDTGLEIKDIHGDSFLLACGAVGLAERILKKLIFELHLPNSIYHKYVSSSFTNFQLQAEGVVVGGYNRNFEHFYNHIMAQYLIQATKAWQKGEITNFEYLMHLNYSAGRSYHDLTQYPVFPWVLSDYSSDVLDLNNPKVFRDLSKPMGALGEKRLVQFVERYSTMEEFVREEEQAARAAKLRMQGPDYDEDEEDWDDFSGSTNTPPPFYYGTHYSCSGYVLYYLLRMQPYASAGVELQGGHFDVADRLFTSIESSWLSASKENLQDVRELIPEFYCLPDFLRNSNGYAFGYTQKDDKVDDVVLPRWAHNDPIEFIAKHREALESQYVSEHLNDWIDLIFGCKQRGKDAIGAYNVFIHLTYPGEVDIDQIDDPVLRAATISQIDNFGQTPVKLFQKSHPKRVVPDLYKTINVPSSQSIRPHSSGAAGGELSSIGMRDRRLSIGGATGGSVGSTATASLSIGADTGIVLDPIAAQWHSHLQPALCTLGANSSQLVKVSYEAAQYPYTCGNMIDIGVGDMKVYNVREKIVAVPQHCYIIPPLNRKFIKLSQRNGTGLGIHSTHIIQRESNDVGQSTVYEMLHSKAITCVNISLDGSYVATGSLDMSVRLWKFEPVKGTAHGHGHGHGHGHSHGAAGVASTLIASSSSVASIKEQSKELHLKHTLSGHFDTITCLDVCTAYQLVVSGGKDRCAILWDLTSGRLVRVISEHDNALLSVSINRLSGNIMTLTRTCVSLHTVNGVLLASALIDRNTPMRNTDYSNIFPATVGMTVPCSYWQDGVELVTGHEGGLVCLWKMKRSRKKLGTTATASTGNSESGYTSPVACLGARSRASSTIIGSESTMSLSLEADSNGDGSGRMPVPKLVSDTYIHRELYVSSTISRVHEDNITALKLCCSATSFAGSSSSFSGASASAVSVPGSAHGYGSLNPTKMKHNKGSNISPQLIENIGSNSDLLVGDAAGYISRWSCHYDQQK